MFLELAKLKDWKVEQHHDGHFVVTHRLSGLVVQISLSPTETEIDSLGSGGIPIGLMNDVLEIGIYLRTLVDQIREAA